MKIRSLLTLIALVFALNMPVVSFADEAMPAAGAPDPAQMEKMKALTSPGEAHKKLEPLVGKWTYVSQFWMTPDAKPMEMTGTTEMSMIYGGRFLKQDIKGMWMNEPWEGMGYTGYDSIRAEYQTVWIDSMMTGLMWMTGQFDDATKTLSQSGTGSCPMTGEKDRKGRSELKIVDNDHAVYQSFSNGPDGKEFKTMEVQYTRAAS